jgi:hypothetical protein
MLTNFVKTVIKLFKFETSNSEIDITKKITDEFFEQTKEPYEKFVSDEEKRLKNLQDKSFENLK